MIRLGSEVCSGRACGHVAGTQQPSRVSPPKPANLGILLDLALHGSSSADMCNAKTQLKISMSPMSCVINHSRDTGAVHWTRLADFREKAFCLDFIGPSDRALCCVSSQGMSHCHRCATDTRHDREYAWKRKAKRERVRSEYMAHFRSWLVFPLPARWNVSTLPLGKSWPIIGLRMDLATA